MAFCNTVNAKKVDENVARRAAINFFTKQPFESKTKIDKSCCPENLELIKVFYRVSSDSIQESLKDNNEAAIFVFTIPNENGFIITSAETDFSPILGYSFENEFDANNIPPQLLDLINRWTYAISNLYLSTHSAEKNNLFWDMLINNDALLGAKTAQYDILPMLETQWGQGQYYNALCPQINGQNTYVGCLATALSQIMKYWNFPECGSGRMDYNLNYGMDPVNVFADMGNTCYDWDNMPNELTANNEAVAALCFNVGASIYTEYGTYSSSASMYTARSAINEYFNYSSDAEYYPFQNQPIDTVKMILLENLNQGYPVLIGADNNQGIGHAYVCDGMQGNYYHLNFGWDGYANGYYNMVDDLDYNNNFHLVSNIHPKTEGINISYRYPMIGDTTHLRFFTEETIPEWSIDPESNLTILPEPNDPKLFNLIFSEMGSYKVSFYDVNGQDTLIIDENSINVAFSSFKCLTPSTSVACGQSLPMKWFDFDNDGDLDLYLSSFFGVGYIYENISGDLVRSHNFNKTYNGSFEVFDYNNDSFLDIVQAEITSVDGIFSMDVFIYENINGNSFQKQNYNLPSLGGGSIIPRDFDNDNQIDLIIYGTDYYNDTCNNGWYCPPQLKILRNNLNSFEIIYEITLDENFRSENMVTCDDFDNDGDIDIYIRSTDDICKFLENTGGIFIENDLYLTGNSITSSDMDNDGKIDLISTYNYSEGPNTPSVVIAFNQNNQFEEEFLKVDESFYYNRCGVNDFNCDGRTDFFVTRTVFPSQRVGFNLFINDTDFMYIPNIGTEYIGPDAHCGDYNNDGYSDVAVGGSVLHNANGTNVYTVNTSPSIPENLQATFNNNMVTFSWERASDAQTPTLGLSYNLMVGTTPTSGDIISPMSNLSTGLRKIVALGNVYQDTTYSIFGLEPGMYYWTVQAIDNGYRGGPFAPMNSIVVCTLPGDAGQISGPNTVCQGQNSVAYSVPAIANATSYTWAYSGTGATISGTTNNVTINFAANATAGYLTVAGTNTCGNGTISANYPITLNLLPAAAGTISGTATVCQGQNSVVYSVPVIANATSYLWAYSATGATINGTSNSITINFANNATTGNLTVYGSNSCGNGTISANFAISVNSVPTADAGEDQSIPNGTSTILNGNASGGSGSYSWHWEPSNLLIDSNVQNPTTVNLTTSVLFTLTVSDSYSCNSFDEVFVNVSGSLTIIASAIPESVCTNEMVQLSAYAGGGSGSYMYSWTSDPVGFTSDLQNPVVYPSVSTTYTVEVNDGVSTISDEVSVTVNPLPIIPEMPIGPDIVDLKDVISSEYSIASVQYSDSYIWELMPETAGDITGFETIGTVVWNPGFLGYAYIKVLSVNTCGQSQFSIEKQTFVDNTIGIKESELPSVLIFPNPNDGLFYINSSLSIDKIIIRDLLGNSILEINNPIENNRMNTDLTDGVYLVHVIIDDYELIKKIIVQK